MIAKEELWEAQRLIEQSWRQEQAPEEARILGFARDALAFLSTTGQRHRFRDHRQQDSSARPPNGSATEGVLQQAERFFMKLLETSQAPEERELLQVVIDALQFIAMTGQLTSLEDYTQHLEEGAPPYVVASFGALQEAEAWLMNHPSPPDFAHVIIEGEYRSVFHDRERNIRKLPDDNASQYYLAELRQAVPPVPVASFDTREAAEAWLWTPPEMSKRMWWILVGGELHLAAYYPNINHRALFPLALVDG
ncbi:hypothetical protein POL68_16400 [Stigmatella sp. ncwal1]|uniref:Uncharacterized protein n=1 Tax=Stigmatella ashevillensis TaxID=2995309 RepID=A0ABT5DB64_9BACT|nr:hypothetical protein [Stigmatella ashevillena]MDC0710058.1 hypothetical protein [Stigmatella ashevillena]